MTLPPEPGGVPQPIPYYLAERIRQGIVVGRYAPGSKLVEQALEAEYGCSRGPIREALRLLDQRGLVAHEPRRGFRVRVLAETDIRQIYALRAVLEQHATAGLEGRVTPALIAALRDANATVKRHRAAHDVPAYLQANLAFHAVLRAAAPNPVLERTIDLVNQMAEPVRHALLVPTLRHSQAAEQHDGIIDMLEAGRVRDAARLMHEHVLLGLPAALAIVESPGEEPVSPR